VRPAEPTPSPAPPSTPPSTGVSIDAEILAQCHLDHGKAFFEFDKSNLSACDLSTINDIAACVSTGPLKGRKLEIVGHADPRGSDEYNLKLGESRAQSVAAYLEKSGVPQDGLVTSSKGKSEATGVDENGWAFDRRVEIHLAK
jgi:peptidoglycan-associated lipoprotein